MQVTLAQLLFWAFCRAGPEPGELRPGRQSCGDEPRGFTGRGKWRGKTLCEISRWKPSHLTFFELISNPSGMEKIEAITQVAPVGHITNSITLGCLS